MCRSQLPGGPGDAAESDDGQANKTSLPREKKQMTDATRTFLKKYETELAELDIRSNKAFWKAANSGKKRTSACD